MYCRRPVDVSTRMSRVDRGTELRLPQLRVYVLEGSGVLTVNTQGSRVPVRRMSEKYSPALSPHSGCENTGAGAARVKSGGRCASILGSKPVVAWSDCPR